MRHPRIIYSTVPLLLLVAVLTAFLLTGLRSSHAVQNPSISLDMVTTGNTYDDVTNTMTLGTIDNCLSADPPGNSATHNHTVHIVIQNIEDLIGWQARMNYLGDQMRPSAVNFIPFTDNITGQNVSFVNLPIDPTTTTHRDVVTGISIPPGEPGPQTALIGSVYLAEQNFPISPDSPHKAVPDDASYNAPTGGVLAALTLQVLAGNAGNPSLFMNLDDDLPNGPGSDLQIFTATGIQTINVPVNQLGDGYHGEGATCLALDCVTQECPSVPETPTPTDTPPPTDTPTPTTPPTATPTPAATAAATPTPVRIPLTLTVNPTGTVSRDGFHVGLGGTLRCTAGHSAFLNVNAFQFVRGQVLLSAFGSASFNCNGIMQNWAVTAESFAGFFKSGHANVRVSLSTFGPAGIFDRTEIATQVRLRKGEPPPESPPESPPIFGPIGGTAGAVGGASVLALAAAGMTLGFVRVVRRNDRRDRDI